MADSFTLLASWTNPTSTRPGDVRRILVYADVKIRIYDNGTASGRVDKDWPLYRREVPSLTDAEWIADPWASAR